MRLWRSDPSIEGGAKYLVVRRDGTIPPWEWFVMGQPDPAAPIALRAYADKAEELSFDPAYVQDIRAMADEWEQWQMVNPPGDPDGRPHRKDNPQIVAAMIYGVLDLETE